MIRSRVGRTSQPVTTAAFTVFVRAETGPSPDRRRHAPGESDGSLPIARSVEKTRCPWFLRPSNQALAPAPFPSGVVGRCAEAHNFALDTKGRADRRLTTTSNDLGTALVDEPMARLHECAMPILKFFGSA